MVETAIVSTKATDADAVDKYNRGPVRLSEKYCSDYYSKEIKGHVSSFFFYFGY